MKFIIATLLLVAACSMITAFSLFAEARFGWGAVGLALCFLSLRLSGWFESQWREYDDREYY